MGLILLKDRNGTYRRTWYAVQSINGKRTSRALKTPLRGKIPTDEIGRFSLALAGDAAFEKSKADALAELDAENKSRKEGGASARKNAEALGVRTVRITDLADENAKRKKYALVDGAREYKYNQSVHQILAHFAEWVAKRPKKKNGKRYYLLSDIDGELVREYYAEISQSQSWQTFKKYVFIIKTVFKHFTGGAISNPFQIEYEEYKGKKSEFGDKASIAHKPPTAEQMARAWEYAKTRTDKPYLHRLAVVAACTGMRIGDCCNLTWDKVDLRGGAIRGVKTKKTGAEISVPIFDYDPKGRDYNPVFGELRRELEAALAEREETAGATAETAEDRAKYVIPEAARIYGYNPSRIIEEGKDVFAHAIAEPDAPEIAMIAGEEPKPKTPAEVLAAIDAATFAQGKKERVRLVYELYTMGKTYKQIAEATGKTKASVSEDLATVERLTGERLRKGVAATFERNRRLELIKATRQRRGQGRLAACLYGWHSCRMFFVGYAFYEIGLAEATIADITGHRTLTMVRHYLSTSSAAAVMEAKRKNAEHNYSRRLLADGDAAGRARTPVGVQGAKGGMEGVANLANAIQAILAAPALTPEAKNAAIAAIAAASASNGGSLSRQNPPVLSGDKLPQIAS